MVPATEQYAYACHRLFNPAGVFWGVNRQSVLLLGGASALLMQVAHPKVAAGVADHSEYRAHPIRRLTRTIATMQDIIFGERAIALAAANRIRAVHSRVRGELRDATSVYPKGTPHCAEDPELVLGVYATLIHTMVETYGTFYRPLSSLERESFYRESRLLARLLGASGELVPPTYVAFQHCGAPFWRSHR